MKNKDYILQLIKNSVKQSMPGATVILFGSYARGDYNEASDIDLLILIDKDKVTRPDKHMITHPLYEIELQTNTLISPMIYSRHAWATHMATPFYENVNREGRQL